MILRPPHETRNALLRHRLRRPVELLPHTADVGNENALIAGTPARNARWNRTSDGPLDFGEHSSNRPGGRRAPADVVHLPGDDPWRGDRREIQLAEIVDPEQ